MIRTPLRGRGHGLVTTPLARCASRAGRMVTMEPMRSPRDEIEYLRRTGDPRLSDAARKLLREITRGPDLAQELAAQAEHDPDLAG